MKPIQYSIVTAAISMIGLTSHAQSTLTIDFDGSPIPSAPSFYSSYVESGMHFGSMGGAFVRSPSGFSLALPDDGTAYLQGAGHSGYNDVVGYFIDGSTFGVSSIDLAAYGGGYNDISAVFRGWLSNGTILTESVSGTGINFRTVNFGPEWSSGLTAFGVANAIDSSDGWSIDNLVVNVPEPASGALLVIGAVTALAFWKRKRLG